MNYHYAPTPIDNFGKNSMGQFSYLAASTLIVFIHGFQGSSLATWNFFPNLTREDDAYKNADILYFGYDTLSGQVSEHAIELYRFLDCCISPLGNGFMPFELWDQERSYKRIILVAHSLGAILARQAQLFAYDEKKEWVNMTTLALFAPAHNGAYILSLLDSIKTSALSTLLLVVKYRFPILRDLDINNSNAIWRTIRDKTEKLLQKERIDFPKAKLVVFAHGDRVVKNESYLSDAIPQYIKYSNHISVCKPSKKNMQPYIMLKKVIQTN